MSKPDMKEMAQMLLREISLGMSWRSAEDGCEMSWGELVEHIRATDKEMAKRLVIWVEKGLDLRVHCLRRLEQMGKPRT